MVSYVDFNPFSGSGQSSFSLPGFGRAIESIFDFLIFSSLFVGIAGMGMIYTSCLLQGIEPIPAILGIMLLVPFSVYNMNRKTDEEEEGRRRVRSGEVSSVAVETCVFVAIISLAERH